MLAISYARVLARALALSGTAAASTDATELAQIASLAAGRLRLYWEHYWWPETMQSEARPYRAAYAAGTTYALGDEVYYPTTGAYYTALGATTGNVPTNATYWTQLTSITPAEVPYTEVSFSPIGKVRMVSATDPLAAAVARRIPATLTSTGVRLLGEQVPNVPYVWYQLRCPDLFGTTYDAATAYAVDDQIYFASGTGSYEGDYWKCITATTAGQTPITHAAKWTRLEIPAFLTEAIAYGIAADLFRAAGKTELAPYMEDKAETALLREQHKVMAAQRQSADSRRTSDNPPGYAVTV
jgi:hypothetical protein